MPMTVRVLTPEDAELLQRADPDVFDGPVDPELIDEFLRDPRHHIAVAIDEQGIIRGMASGFLYVHPDKRAQYFVNEVGVANAYRRQGLGRRVLEALLLHAKNLGCTEAWVATEQENEAARGLYREAGGIEAPETIVMYTFDLSRDMEG